MREIGTMHTISTLSSDKVSGGKSVPSVGKLGVALTRHRVTCGSKPGVGGIFSCFGPFLLHAICH